MAKATISTCTSLAHFSLRRPSASIFTKFEFHAIFDPKNWPYLHTFSHCSHLSKLPERILIVELLRNCFWVALTSEVDSRRVPLTNQVVGVIFFFSLSLQGTRMRIFFANYFSKERKLLKNLI